MWRKVIKADLLKIKKEYALPRKTQIEDAKAVVLEEKKVQEQEVMFIMDRFGYAKTIDMSAYERNKEAVHNENRYVFSCKNTDKICIFTDNGSLHQIKVLDIPFTRFRDKGTPIDNLGNYDSSGENILYLTPFEQLKGKKMLFMTKLGMAKLVDTSEFEVSKRTVAATKLQEDDLLVGIYVTDAVKEVFSRFSLDGEVKEKVEDEATVASAQPEVKEVEAPVVKSEYEDKVVAVVDDYVNVRKKPTTDSKAVGKLYKNNVGTVIGEKDGWYKIKSGSVTGYVKSEFVSIGDEKKLKKAGRRVALVETETLKVRKGASQKAEVITLVPEGDDLTVLDESKDGWAKVSVDEGKGYVSTDYVTLSTEYTYAESAAEEKARLQKEKEEREAADRAAQKAESASQTTSSGSSQSQSSDSSVQDSSSASSTGSAVASYAGQFVGNPYVYGGTSLTNGTDCSGFVMSVYAHFGVSLPHSSSALRSVGYGVSTSNMQPGDIVFL